MDILFFNKTVDVIVNSLGRYTMECLRKRCCIGFLRSAGI